MQKIRSHIVKLCTISLLWFGLGLYVVQPAQANNSSARSFTNWFSSVAQKTDTHEFARELNRLKDSGVKLSDLIEHASYMISKNNEHFNLPLKGASASHQIYQVLLDQWSQSQTGGMASVPPPETVKPGLSLQVDKSGTVGYGDIPDITVIHCSYPETCNMGDCHFLDRSLTPMVTGIAIGAP